MKLSATSAYAIRACLQLAGAQDSAVTCQKLSAQGQMPERFLLQVLRHLVKAGVLRSARGAGGGFILARPANSVSLLDIIEAVEGPLPVGLPPGVAGFSEPTIQRLKDSLAAVADRTRGELGKISVAYLIGEEP